VSMFGLKGGIEGGAYARFPDDTRISSGWR
jgi:hypothetical protein